MSIEQTSALKAAEQHLNRALRRMTGLQERLEDFLFRAQRLANSLKRSLEARDAAFGPDLQALRGEFREFGAELETLPPTLERLASHDRRDGRPLRGAPEIVELSERLSGGLRTLHAQSRLAYEQTRQAALKTDVWALVQDADLLSVRAARLSAAARKLLTTGGETGS